MFPGTGRAALRCPSHSTIKCQNDQCFLCTPTPTRSIISKVFHAQHWITFKIVVYFCDCLGCGKLRVQILASIEPQTYFHYQALVKRCECHRVFGDYLKNGCPASLLDDCKCRANVMVMSPCEWKILGRDEKQHTNKQTLFAIYINQKGPSFYFCL